MNIKCIKFSTESPRCLSLVVSLGFLTISYESLIRWGNKKIYQKKGKSGNFARVLTNISLVMKMSGGILRNQLTGT